MLEENVQGYRPVVGGSLEVTQKATILLTVFDCARGRCPAYFSDICVSVHSVAGRSRLRSADHGDLIVPRVQT